MAANPKYTIRALFSEGFRPFFLTALGFTILETLVWVISRLQGIDTEYPGSHLDRHDYEILFGYGGVFLSGFLLTAVRNWTGIPDPKGQVPATLLSLWFLARLLPLFPGPTAVYLAGLAEVLFFTVMTAIIAGSLLQTRSRNSYVFIELLIIFTLGNILFHWAQMGFWIYSAGNGIWLSLFAIVAMLIILNGRVLPFTIEKALGIDLPAALHGPLAETVALLAIYGLMIVEILFPNPWIAGLLSLTTAIAIGVRISFWYHPDIRRHPLILFTYSGLLWLVLGFLFHAAFLLNLLPNDAGLPALLAGGIGILSASMMVRVIRSYRREESLHISDTTAAFILLNIATLASVVDAVTPTYRGQILFLISALCWITAFAFLLKAYGPCLLTDNTQSPN